MPFDGAAAKRKTRKALVADLFCGAGGTSTGATQALRDLGYEIELVAVNHWQTAVNTHAVNHPRARHYCQDVNVAKPIELVPEGYLDLLLASPTCTFFSRARGGKPINDQGRMDPWAIVHWCTELRVKRLIVENVPEYVDWAPLDRRTGRPIKSRRGEYFRAWEAALNAIGMKGSWRIINCADHGDATTRERFFWMGRSDNKRLVWPSPTHSRTGEADLFGNGGQKWRAAREIIDWDIKGRSIFNRKKGLAPKTLDRIIAGGVKFKWPGVLIEATRIELVRQLVSTIQRCDITIAKERKEKKRKAAIRSKEWCIGRLEKLGADGPAPDGDSTDPMIVMFRQHADGRTVDAPLPAICAEGYHAAIAEAFILSQHTSGSPRTTGLPLPTILCGGASDTSHPGCARPAVVEGFLLNRHGENGSVRAFVLSQASGGAPRTVDDPIPAITTGGAGGAHALLCPYYGSGSGLTCASPDRPIPALTAKMRYGLVLPVTHGEGGGPRPRSTDDPLPALTTAKGGEFAFVMPVTHGDDVGRVRAATDPLPTITGAPRGELACIVAAFGEREGQAPRVHSIDNPIPTICAKGRTQLAQVSIIGEDIDILFRMLDPKRELARAMSFSDEDIEYEFTGTKTEITKQIGNAVPVRTAKALVYAQMNH